MVVEGIAVTQKHPGKIGEPVVFRVGITSNFQTIFDQVE